MADPKPPTEDEARAIEFLRLWIPRSFSWLPADPPVVAFLVLLAEVRAEATGTTVARYHILLQDIYAVLNPEEHDALCERVMDALENCPPACSRPECEEIGFEKGKAEGAREERAEIVADLRSGSMSPYAASFIADRIERGDHQEEAMTDQKDGAEMTAPDVRALAESLAGRHDPTCHHVTYGGPIIPGACDCSRRERVELGIKLLTEAHLAGRREGIGWALKSAADIVRASYPCTCGEAYKSRRLTAPDCFRCVPLEEAAVEIEGLLDRRALPDEPKPTDPCNADPTTE